VAGSPYTVWCRDNECSHGHCPLGCEHPQPSTWAGDARIICGCCYFTDGTVSLVVPCTVQLCGE